ncbi:T-cell surface glycoprotein CD3 epsilon chain isoform X1 [Tachyglossus aculeatus]|uniref:T-cell surface glycoprotein CD3 epsilon chain isoform X1 n=1 Tax=Tachyglossus aculeatus TaxID=9261 RepID=UPI0018F6C284|nr:T-cell surface glycoprotein CD3 epsilon chain isoform X1 [Tachyglossus aculeatus]
MGPRTFWAVLGIWLMAARGVWSQEGDELGEEKNTVVIPFFDVSISGTTVTITCPKNERSVKWIKAPEKAREIGDNTVVVENFSEVEHSGLYRCEVDQQIYDLYLRARVCEMCVEVDLLSVAGIVVGDVLVTLGVLVLVYYWSKSRKGQATGRGAGTTGRPRGPTKERPPPVPSPDYEPIRKGQRDVYSGLNQRGI